MVGKDYYKEYISEKTKLPELIETEEQRAIFAENMKLALEQFRSTMEKYEFSSIGEYQAFFLNQKYKLSNIKEALNQIPTTAEKLKFLYQIQTDYDHDLKNVKRGEPKSVGVKSKETGLFQKLFDAVPMGNYVDDSVFEIGNELKIEIEKYEKIFNLEKDVLLIKKSQYTESPYMKARQEERARQMAISSMRRYQYMPEESKDTAESEKGKIGDRENRQKEKGLNREIAFLFCNYLFEAVNCVGTNVRKAEVVEFLTGYSATKLKEVPAWFNKEKAKVEEKEEIDEKYFNDLKTVRKFFELLGLDKITQSIDKDLGENY